MKINNARIEQVSKHSFVVIGDTERFGKEEVLFQDISRKSAEDYIRRNDPQAVWTYKPLDVITTISVNDVPAYVRTLVA